MTDVFSAYNLDDLSHDETTILIEQAHDSERLMIQLLLEYQLLKQREILMNLVNLKGLNETCTKKLSSKVKKPENLVRCSARTFNGLQCTRKSKDGSVELCGNHLQAIPYGRITEEIPDSHQMIGRKTRGRKSKNIEEEIPLSEIDLDQYVKTEPICIAGKDYLIDDQGVIFSYDSSNSILAIQVDNGQFQWLIEE